MKNLDLTPKDRTIIAEFVFSNQADVLIKSDAISLIDMLFNHKIINKQRAEELTSDVNKQNHDVVGILTELLSNNIPEKQGIAIMSEYYGNSKYEI